MGYGIWDMDMGMGFAHKSSELKEPAAGSLQSAGQAGRGLRLRFNPI
jgi:hypothetical protein